MDEDLFDFDSQYQELLIGDEDKQRKLSIISFVSIFKHNQI